VLGDVKNGHGTRIEELKPQNHSILEISPKGGRLLCQCLRKRLWCSPGAQSTSGQTRESFGGWGRGHCCYCTNLQWDYRLGLHLASKLQKETTSVFLGKGQVLAAASGWKSGVTVRVTDRPPPGLINRTSEGNGSTVKGLLEAKKEEGY